MNPYTHNPGQDSRSWTFQICSRNRVCIILLMFVLASPAAAALSDRSLLIAVTDAETGSGLAAASVYIDGRFAGETSAADIPGTLRTDDPQQGSHMIRITAPGYQSLSKKVIFPDESVVRIGLTRNHLVSLNPENKNPHTISIIFIPSSTYYRTSDNSKVRTDTYSGNETRLREDVTRVISAVFNNLDRVTDPAEPLPADFRDRFTFYYYFDPALTADAFSGCAGFVPPDYWNSVTFSDLTIILYPRYEGWYTNASSQPVGCFMNSGTGHSQLKIPADRDLLFLHEIGHGLFGLVDTYCGETDYFQNDPYPNVWSTLDACRAGATADNRDPSRCRRIEQDVPDSISCRKNFWSWDPDPDLMKTTNSGTFGRASTERIAYILTRSGMGSP
ncbi:MAG: PEGA domain-containing protein [Methanoregula sp.]